MSKGNSENQITLKQAHFTEIQDIFIELGEEVWENVETLRACLCLNIQLLTD